MDAVQPDEIWSRQDALADGRSDDDLARLVRQGAWVRLRRGAYMPGPLVPDGAAARHRLMVLSTVKALRRPAVVSHQSAAVLLGLPLWNVPLDKVHVTRCPPASSDLGRILRCHVARLRDDEVLTLGPLSVTDPVRTMLDLARSLRFESAVVALDAGLHQGRVLLQELQTRLFDLAGTPGSRAAARAIRFADGRSESVGESRSRIVMHKVGIAPPALQLPITTPAGRLLGRADFAWEEHRVVGEFDGRVKYGRLLRPGQEPGDVVFQEKRREDAIRDVGWEVTRWTWADLEHPQRLAQRLKTAIDRGDRRPR